MVLRRTRSPSSTTTASGHFAELYEQEYKARFEAAGIRYKYMLIDSAVAGLMQCPGGILWACKTTTAT